MYEFCETCISFPFIVSVVGVKYYRVGDESESSVSWKIQPEIQINSFIYIVVYALSGCLDAWMPSDTSLPLYLFTLLSFPLAN